MRRRKRLWRASLAGFLLLAAVAAILPFLRAPWLAGPLKRALESSLARKVEFSEVRCALLPAPSLVAYEVVIAEDPAFGLEPFVYADELRASLRIPALLRGAVEPAEIRLAGASLNLARTEKSGFNLVAFLEKALSSSSQSGNQFAFSLRQSRINFRQETVKSAFYLNAVDLDLEPPRRPGGELRWRYEASPARTDRSEQGFGRFSGAGRWTPGGPRGRFAVDVALERSSFSELLLLLAGRDLGLQGRFSARAFVDGPFDALEVRGALHMLEFERPGFFGIRGKEFELPLRGRLDLDRQALDLASAPPEKGKAALPLRLRLQGNNLLTSPRWDAELAFDQLPAPVLLDVCHRLGLETPPGLAVEAAVSGAARFATGRPASGEVTVPEARVRLGDGPPLQASGAVLRLEGELLSLEQARLETPQGAAADVSGLWDIPARRLRFEVATSGMSVAETSAAVASLPGLGPLPFFSDCPAGRWRGRLAMVRDFAPAETGSPALWSGQAALDNARFRPPGLPSPVLLESALLELKGEGWALRNARARFGASVFRLSAEFRPGPASPLELHIDADQLHGEDLERVFTAARPPRASFLDRTLRRRPPAPSWLRQFRLKGTFQADLLRLGRQEFSGVRSRLACTPSALRFEDLSARWRELAFHGHAEALFRQDPFPYRLRGVLGGNIPGAGWLDAEMEAKAGTLASAIAASVNGWGEVSSASLHLPAGHLRQMQASVEYDGARGPQPWRLPSLVFWMDGQFWSGRGQADAGGGLRLEFGVPPGAVWEGSLWPPAAAPASR
jgi:hypothetical protein